MNGQEVSRLRAELGLDRAAFSRLLGVDVRTVTRWETTGPFPAGPSAALLAAFRESLDRRPTQAQSIVQVLAGAAALGGLAYLVIKLLDDATEPRPPRRPRTQIGSAVFRRDLVEAVEVSPHGESAEGSPCDDGSQTRTRRRHLHAKQGQGGLLHPPDHGEDDPRCDHQGAEDQSANE